MIMLRDIYTGENICAFDNETDAFEMVMALVEEEEYETYFFHILRNGTDEVTASAFAKVSKNVTAESLYFQEFPYIQGDFPYIKEDN